jgi:DNA-binding CsgD family transcriptional regulator
MKLLETSGELLMSHSHQGIKLVSPQNSHRREKKDVTNLNSVRDVLKLPINVYFLNRDGVIQNINEITADTGGFSCVQSSLGKSVVMTATKEAAERALRDNSEVIHAGKMKIFDESFVRHKDEVIFSALSFKFPWYDEDNHVIGLFGFSILLNPNNGGFANDLELVIKMGLLNNSKNGDYLESIIPGREIAGKYLSNQEIKCLRLLLRGMTMKMIARCLGISPRTVEHYLENIKIKLNVNSKPELIDKMMDYFLTQEK